MASSTVRTPGRGSRGSRIFVGIFLLCELLDPDRSFEVERLPALPEIELPRVQKRQFRPAEDLFEGAV
jgi:hypothetical protein